MHSLEGAVAVVTGAASGIGLALATKAAKLGMQVVMADIAIEQLTAASSALSTQGHEVLACPTDVSNQDDLINLAEHTVKHFGIPTLLFNNAGIGGPIGPIWSISLTKLQTTWDVNVLSIIYSLRAFMPYFLNQKQPATIINTASMAGFYSAPYLSSYEISKHAAVALTEALHHDLKIHAPHVKAAVLCPGWVKTQIVDKDLATDNPENTNNNYSDDDLRWLLNFARSVKKGIAPEQVAEQVFSAIAEGKFYIFTDHSMKSSIIEKRLAAIMADSEPVAFEV